MAWLVVAGCVPRLDVPKVERQKPAKIANRADLAPIQLEAMRFKLRRGTKIGTCEYMFFANCYPFIEAVYWNRGRVNASDVEYADLLFEAMTDANFNVVSDPKKIFKDGSSDVVKPAYLIGGQIEEIRMNVCDHISIWDDRRLGTQSGKGYVKVKWQVFSLFDCKIVFQAETTGYADIEEPATDGEMVILTESFAEAAANLATNEYLVALLSKGAPALTDIRATEDVRLLIPRRAASCSTDRSPRTSTAFG